MSNNYKKKSLNVQQMTKLKGPALDINNNNVERIEKKKIQSFDLRCFVEQIIV